MELKATAKINLGLDVLRKREDGYHEVRMVMQMTGMYDRLVLTPLSKRGGIFLKTNHAYIPENENNLAYKAAKLLMDEFSVSDGLSIRLDKFIPVAAGLAGGSTDAAAVLNGVNELFHLGLSREELMERGGKIGADVPYCILGGTALAEGIGEKLSPLPAMPSCSILLAKPPVFISTKEVYGALRADSIERHPDIDGIIDALKRQELRELSSLMGNVLEDVTAPMHPVIREMEREMEEGGALRAVMSGSGPTVFGLFDDYDAARKCRNGMRKKYSSARIFLTEPCTGRE
ncbi:MAG: 4-(cytidine 5'-diphospho)-2-C-methyl-D-erythritol kinase [Lachnospiraceae bacterium]|nr:4-(cytidine 5'-diphospho)-2-C-methyl-D-erythritol kinase [Lachnospiraceae bacterium]